MKSLARGILPRIHSGAAVRLVVVLILVISGTAAAQTSAPEKVRRLVLEPASIEFAHPGDQRRVLISGRTEDGRLVDLTSTATLTLVDQTVQLASDGFLEAAQPGSGVVRVEAGGQTATLQVEVAGGGRRPPSYIRDVSPVLNKVGCTSGPCHGAAKGKNGFKLSLRGYDPSFDYQALLYDLSSRRFNRADPARSLLLAKPAQQAPHGGGLRLEVGSRYYRTILEWIEQSVPFGDPDSDKVVELRTLPREILMHGPGGEQTVSVVAVYGDGTTRDVTREAHLASSNTETVNVADAVVSGLRNGESTLLVRYEGKFGAVPVTILNPAPGFEFSALPHYNYIDELNDAKLARLKIQPSSPATDAEFLRRVYLDLTGALPGLDAIRSFLDDPAPGRDKRSKAIDRLIGSPAFVDYWTLRWGDLLRSNRKFLSDKGMWGFREWLHDSIAANKPYNQLVQELLTAKGSSFDNPAANFYRVARDPKEAMETTTQLFLGVRMVCAQCHDHPFERWTQDQYFEMSAFFAAVGVRPGFQSGEEIVYLKRSDNAVKHPKDGRAMAARYLVPVSGAPEIANQTDPRNALAGWLTSENNPFFAMAISNRVFSYFMGRGIIEPVDDIRASNPPVNPELLRALTEDFKRSGFDLRHLMRTIANSRTYQASFRTNEWNQGDAINFSHFVPRRLAAEQLADAVAAATESPVELEGVPADFNAVQSPDPHAGMDGFLNLFGRSQRETSCECERKTEVSLPQAMNLVNGPTLADAVGDPDGRIARLLVDSASNKNLIEELYLSTLSRLPTPGELDLAATHLSRGESKAAAAQDLLWALLNSNAFLFNR